MDERTEAFLTYLRNRGDASFAEIESDFEVGRRTIYNYVRRANEALSGAGEVVIERGRLRYVTSLNHGADATASSGASSQQTDEAPGQTDLLIPVDHAERVAWMIQTLLMQVDWITIDGIAERIHVTRRTVSHDLRDVERELKRFDLALEKRPRYGMRVVGSEMMRRLCLVHALGDAIVADESSSPRCFISEAIKISSSVQDIVERTLEQESFPINSFALHGLVAHVTMTVMRVLEGAPMSMDASQLERITAAREFPVAEKIDCALNEEFGCTLPVEDIAYISIHLAGRQSLYDLGDNDVVITDKVWDVVTRMLNRVFETYRIDFSNDLELRMNLARHIVPLSMRLHYRMSLGNPMLADIRKRFPLEFAMAADSSTVLVETYGEQLSEEEIGYLAMAFILAMERQSSGIAKKRVLVVCASGASSARLLKMRYAREFHDCIGCLDVCDVMSTSRVDWSRYDYVFTTVPLPSTPPIPVREVGDLFDPEEADVLRTALRLGGSAESLRALFSERLFFAHVDVDDKREVLQMLCDAAVAEQGLDPSFTDLVFQREEIAPTAFGNSVAMPHPAAAVSERSFIAVALLNHPIAWNDLSRAVRAVFLVSPAKTGGRELNSLFGTLAELFSSADLMGRLIEDQSYATLMELIEAVGG